MTISVCVASVYSYSYLLFHRSFPLPFPSPELPLQSPFIPMHTSDYSLLNSYSYYKYWLILTFSGLSLVEHAQPIKVKVIAANTRRIKYRVNFPLKISCINRICRVFCPVTT